MEPRQHREHSLLAVTVPQPAALDPGFQPAVLAARAYREALARHAGRATLLIALERTQGTKSVFELELFPEGSPHDGDTLIYAERTIKFLLWSRGGWRLSLAGPPSLCRKLAALYQPGGARDFDVKLMTRAFGRPFEVPIVAPEQIPREAEAPLASGGQLQGCRLGFDLGASDYKVAAVHDGEVVFSGEFPWDPVRQNDPDYHLGHLNEGLKNAASHLPRVDAIGGSAAGIYVDNRIMMASLFRSVPAEVFEARVKPLFLNLQKEWGVPLVVVNDGEVTALAGALSLHLKPLLGIAMGSSEAAGFLDRRGRITGWLNELAFAPVDFNPKAPRDEWSGDRGVGALYFSQQAVNKLAPAAGFSFPEEMGLPERLVAVQSQADRGVERAEAIFRTIGLYLGYSIAHYADHYDFSDLLLLGRVTSGRGGELILEQARQVLASEFSELAQAVTIHVPDEKSRRVGQAVAAASLPAFDGGGN